MRTVTEHFGSDLDACRLETQLHMLSSAVSIYREGKQQRESLQDVVSTLKRMGEIRLVLLSQQISATATDDTSLKCIS